MRVIRRDAWPGRWSSLAFVLLFAFAGVGCDTSQTTLPPPECPVLPTKWTFVDVGALGHTAVSPPGLGFVIYPLPPGTIAGNIVLEPFNTRKVTSVFAFLQGGDNATPTARAVIYKADAAGMPTGEPLAASAQIEIAAYPAHWYRFDFPDDGVVVGPGSYLIGIWTGGVGTTRLFSPGDTVTLTGFSASVPYNSTASPPPNPSGSPGGRGWALYGLYADSVEVDPSAYTPAAPVDTTSINLELGQLYMRTRVIDALQTKGIDDPYPEAGIAIDDVQLVQGSAGDANPHTLVVRFTPWLRGAQGAQVSLQRSYRLTLRVTPFLLTPDTEPNVSKRSIMLGKDENGQPLNDGIAIRFDLVELRSLSYDQKVECKPDAKGFSTNPNFDEIDKRILAEVSTSLAIQHPLVLPTKAVTDVFSSLDAPSTIDGVNLGTDRDFKIGLRVKDVAGQTFDPQTNLGRFPSTDWAIDIDPTVMKSAIGKKATNEADKLGPLVAVAASSTAKVRVEIDPGGIVRIYQPMEGCGSGNLGNMYVRVMMSIARIGPNGPPPSTRYVLNAPQDIDFDARVKTCLNTKPLIFFGGLNFARVGQCEVMTDIQFKASPNDWFYATALDTDGVFYIAGRSTFVDASRSTVPPVPVCS
jgi:hypothetical protein